MGEKWKQWQTLFSWDPISLWTVTAAVKLKDAWKWQPPPVFCPWKSHAQRSLTGYSPWGRRRVSHNLATKQQKPSMRKYFPIFKVSTLHFNGTGVKGDKTGTNQVVFSPSFSSFQVPIWQITGNRHNFKNRSSFMEKAKLTRWFVWKGWE